MSAKVENGVVLEGWPRYVDKEVRVSVTSSNATTEVSGPDCVHKSDSHGITTIINKNVSG